jgi:hypothetical protein
MLYFIIRGITMRERGSIAFKAITLGIIACFLGSILPQEAYAQSALNLPETRPAKRSLMEMGR